MKIRKAKIKDVKHMHDLINEYAQKREMLGRPLSELYENVQEFVVAEEKGKIVGCGALHISWEDLAEVKALAIDEKYQRKGIGTRIVKECHKISKSLGVNKVFALTFKPKFFLGLGYNKISRNKLPHKVWGECVRCSYFPNCGEIALIRDI